MAMVIMPRWMVKVGGSGCRGYEVEAEADADADAVRAGKHLPSTNAGRGAAAVVSAQKLLPN